MYVYWGFVFASQFIGWFYATCSSVRVFQNLHVQIVCVYFLCVYAFDFSDILCLGTIYHCLGMSVSVYMYIVHVHISVLVTTWKNYHFINEKTQFDLFTKIPFFLSFLWTHTCIWMLLFPVKSQSWLKSRHLKRHAKT